MSEIIWRRRISCLNNGDFISIQAYSGYRSSIVDPKAEEYLLPIDETDEEIGMSILRSLPQSRFLSLEEMTFLSINCQKDYESWIEKLKNIYGYKTKKALFKNMMSCDVELNNGVLTFVPTHHDRLEGWGRSEGQFTEEDDVVIPENSTPAEVGAALRLAFSRCTTRGF
jgi:hypothetical protein